ncbi:hypothetical protein MUP79_02620 [Candidatus Bathyarchaeota archaeon]|nr:hypothetical protein [Candidatus Bathyarchaeota archaeon]
MNKKLFASALTLAMLLSVLAAVPVFAVPPNGGILHIVPNPINLVGAGAGTEVEVSITIDNINPAGPGVGGLSVKLQTSDISIVKFKAGSASLTVGHFMDPDGSAEGEANLWKVVPPKVALDGSTTECATTFYDMTIAASHGDVPIYAGGVIMKVKIVVVAEPPYGGSVSALLSFVTGDCVIGSPEGVELTSEKGKTCQYMNQWSPPSGVPHLEVIPKDTVLTALGQRFNVSIVIKNLDDDWRLVGFNFKLNYDETMLLITNAYNGTFLETYAGAPNGGVFYMGPVNGPDYVIVGGMILPDEFGTYHPDPILGWSHGEGTLYIVEFEGILQGVYPTTYSCALDLEDSWVDFGNYVGEMIPKDPSVDGTYLMKPVMPVAMGKVIDVYTCNYSFPWGAQGVANETSGEFMFSDMFWPQKEVCLCANVTYNGWPVQQKDVAFEVMLFDVENPDLNDTVMTVLVARTDENGFASVSFRMNWPCDDPESLFGIWKVTATVDIACTVVTDYFYFKYDYLVHIWKVTVDPEEAAHGDWIDVTVEFGSHKILPLESGNVTIAVTLHDELNYPLITGTVWFTQTLNFEECNYTLFEACTYKNYTGIVHLHIDKSVAAGIATLHVCALSDWPHLEGTALCDEYAPAPTITIVPF